MKSQSIIIVALSIIMNTNCTRIQAQKENIFKLESTTETFINPNFIDPVPDIRHNFYLVGYNQDTLLLEYSNIKNKRAIYKLDGDTFKLEIQSNQLSILEQVTKIISVYNSNIFYRKYSFDVDSQEYQELYLQTNNKDHYLFELNNPDKKVNSSFSSDGKFLIVSTFFKLSDYYDPDIDNKFTLYSMDSLSRGVVHFTEIPCSLCSNPKIIGDNLFFAQAQGKDETGNFETTHIYMAPLENINDTVRIATFSDILAISPDGKYILGTRLNDLPNYPTAIFDVENRSYQLMLGRHYSRYSAFYSHQEEKFAFWINRHIVYLDFPDEYPFDALQISNPDIPPSSEFEFYREFEHPPIE